MLALFALLLPVRLFDAATLRGATVSAYAIDAESGRVLYARNADLAMQPASTLKLVVGSAALDELGDGFAFTTTLLSDGTTLYLRGGGDPLLTPVDFDDAARALAAAGATHFDAFDGDTSAIEGGYPDGWALDDLPYDYAAQPSALSIDENFVAIGVTPGAAGTAPTLVPGIPNLVTIRNDATTGPARSTDTTALHLALEAPNTMILTGSVPADERDDEIDVAILDPARATLTLARDALVRDGIALGDAPPSFAKTPANARVLWVHRGHTLPWLLQAMWWPSDNLLAESLLDAFAPTRAAALDRERAWLRRVGVDPASTTLADGSGLSNYDRISARDLVTILAHDWNGPHRTDVLDALPVAGEHGTLADAFLAAPLKGAVVAKTGSMNHTRTLAGYMLTPHGTVIFALMINGWMDDGPNADANVRAVQAAFMEPFFE